MSLNPSYIHTFRSHAFDFASQRCVFCGRGLSHFYEHGWAFCSSAWTGRRLPPEGPIRQHWKFWPLEWSRVGVVYALRIGPISIAGFIGRDWRFFVGSVRIVEV